MSEEQKIKIFIGFAVVSSESENEVQFKKKDLKKKAEH